MIRPNKEIMLQVIDYAKKKNNIAAFIVKDDIIISKAINTTTHINQSTKHAEINAIEKASKILKNRHLKNCWLYTSLEPCVMCASASCWARLKGVVYCLNENDAPFMNNSKHNYIDISADYVFSKSKYSPILIKNYLRKEGLKKGLF